MDQMMPGLDGCEATRILKHDERTAAVPVILVTGNGAEATEGLAFTADLHEVVLTHLNEAGDRLVIEFWHPGKGLRTVERE